MKTKPGTIFGRNPLLFYMLIQALIGLIVSLGFDLSGETVYYIMLVSNIVLTIIANTQVVPLPIAQEKINEALMTPPPVATTNKQRND